MVHIHGPPLRLSIRPHVFSKIQKALVKHWREQGIRIFTYLDDEARADGTLEAASSASSRVKADVAASGFVAHLKNAAGNQHKKVNCVALS